jgi:hypothetical protein
LWTEKIQVWFSFLSLHGGRFKQTEVIDYFNPDTAIGGSGSMASWHPADVKGGHFMIMDKRFE